MNPVHVTSLINLKAIREKEKKGDAIAGEAMSAIRKASKSSTPYVITDPLLIEFLSKWGLLNQEKEIHRVTLEVAIKYEQLLQGISQ